MTIIERRAETARFTAFVNDRDAGAYPNERLAIRVAEKNLALAERFHEVLEIIAAQSSGVVGSTNRADCMAALAAATIRGDA